MFEQENIKKMLRSQADSKTLCLERIHIRVTLSVNGSHGTNIRMILLYLGSRIHLAMLLTPFGKQLLEHSSKILEKCLH